MGTYSQMADLFNMSLTDSPWSNHRETGYDTPIPVSSSSYGTGYSHGNMIGTTGDDDNLMDTMDVVSNDKHEIRQMVASHDSLYFGGWSDDRQASKMDGVETDKVWGLTNDQPNIYILSGPRVQKGLLQTPSQTPSQTPPQTPIQTPTQTRRRSIDTLASNVSLVLFL